MGGRWAASRHVKSVRVCRPHPWAHPPHPGRGVGGVLQLHLRYLRNNSLRGASGSAARGDAGASAPPDPRAHGPRSRGHARAARAASRLPLALPPDCDLWILCDGRNRRRAERDGPHQGITAQPPMSTACVHRPCASKQVRDTVAAKAPKRRRPRPTSRRQGDKAAADKAARPCPASFVGRGFTHIGTYTHREVIP